MSTVFHLLQELIRTWADDLAVVPLSASRVFGIWDLRFRDEQLAWHVLHPKSPSLTDPRVELGNSHLTDRVSHVTPG